MAAGWRQPLPLCYSAVGRARHLNMGKHGEGGLEEQQKGGGGGGEWEKNGALKRVVLVHRGCWGRQSRISGRRGHMPHACPPAVAASQRTDVPA